MNKLLGKPGILKQVNLSLIRKAVKESGSATRAEIVNATGISVTTVRALLGEMLENGEIAANSYDQSSGGRKAVRYQLQKNKFLGAVFCLDGAQVRYCVVNICGEICESGSFAAKEPAAAICAFLDDMTAQKDIRSIGIGVPGIVHGLRYQRQNASGALERFAIGEVIREKYGVPVLLENDLNAITLGFGRCYLKQYPEEHCENLHMAYLHFEATCVSAGFLVNGHVLRGWNNFVGELGLFPLKGDKTLDDLLSLPLPDRDYADLVSKLIAGICCVLNPQYIAVGGAAFRRHCLPFITEAFNSVLPDEMSAEILYGGDVWQDYMEGMAYLTAEQIFTELKLVQE